jgi:poly-gamma-glutamate system protein
MNRSYRIIAAGLVSFAALWTLRLVPPDAVPGCADAMIRAGRIMEQAILAIRSQREQAGAEFDSQADPNRTGLIGPEMSPLMTTLGDLEAKRSTTNPNVAAYMVYLLFQAGVRPGDRIAIASSGSFPALLVASLAAAKAMEAAPVTILSLGASSYGATDPDFTLLDIYDILRREHICNVPPAAISLGGDKDVGLDLEAEIRDRLAQKIQASRVPFLNEPALSRNVAERLRIYELGAAGKITAFINSGGGYANLGTSPLALDVRPGLNRNLTLPAAAERGVLFEMSARRVPVIHLLFIRGLVTQAGLPWDPIPLPEPGVLPLAGAGKNAGFWFLSAGYFALLLLLALYRGGSPPAGRAASGSPPGKDIGLEGSSGANRN